ncbi:hypothetical protein [Pollutibacter soli]|uniref:hypothetical protein n=1 Tax=Pollutibacter soli TaxID=3034157 RepID=UPI0030136A62
MKFLVSIILTALLAFALGLYLPWWSIAIASFAVAVFIHLKPGFSFLSGLIALFLLWGTMAWARSAANQDILANKMSVLVLKTENSLLLVLVTALIGALIGGLAALSGSLLRSVMKSNN